MSDREAPPTLIGQSAAMQRVRDQIARVAPSPVPVLILGETGTGKELCAAAIARASGRSPFVPVNCAAFPEGLAESELFGHERGAFTGAIRAHQGVVAVAHGGVLFLDELAELPGPMQAKLLRTLESGEYRPIGATRVQRSDFRILAATSGDLDVVIASGRLRQDLMHRLGAIRVFLPPLRRRVEDIPLLVGDFLRSYGARCGTSPFCIAEEAQALLMQHDWPGNIRQLRNVVEAAATMALPGHEVSFGHVLPFIAPPAQGEPSKDDIPSLAQTRNQAEQRAILDALSRTGGNRERAASLLRISPATLYRKIGRRARQIPA